MSILSNVFSETKI